MKTKTNLSTLLDILDGKTSNPKLKMKQRNLTLDFFKDIIKKIKTEKKKEVLRFNLEQAEKTAFDIRLFLKSTKSIFKRYIQDDKIIIEECTEKKLCIELEEDDEAFVVSLYYKNE